MASVNVCHLYIEYIDKSWIHCHCWIERKLKLSWKRLDWRHSKRKITVLSAQMKLVWSSHFHVRLKRKNIHIPAFYVWQCTRTRKTNKHFDRINTFPDTAFLSFRITHLREPISIPHLRIWQSHLSRWISCFRVCDVLSLLPLLRYLRPGSFTYSNDENICNIMYHSHNHVCKCYDAMMLSIPNILIVLPINTCLWALSRIHKTKEKKRVENTLICTPT